MSRRPEDIELSSAVGELFARWLRSAYPDSRAKRLARDFSVAEVTAKRWLAGNLPDTSILLRMLAHWGAPFAAQVLSPTGPWTRLATLERDLTNLGRSLDEASRLLAEARRDADAVVEPAARLAAPGLREVAS